MSELAQQILAHVTHANYRPVKPRVIAKQLGIEADKARTSSGRSSSLCGKESSPTEPVTLSGWRPSPINRGWWASSGRFPAGHGFVMLPASLGKEKPPDIYIPAKSTHDAATGDTVLVRLRKSASSRRFRGGDQKQEGEIVEILERDTNRFVGVYFESGGMGWSRSMAPCSPSRSPSATRAQKRPARRQSRRRNGPLPVARSRRRRRDHRSARPRGEPGIDTLSIIHEFNLPGDFAPTRWRKPAARPSSSTPRSATAGLHRRHGHHDRPGRCPRLRRRDFARESSTTATGGSASTSPTFPTSCDPRRPLDREARDRATSVYLPDRVIPMLPEVISNNLASLAARPRAVHQKRRHRIHGRGRFCTADFGVDEHPLGGKFDEALFM